MVGFDAPLHCRDRSLQAIDTSGSFGRRWGIGDVVCSGLLHELLGHIPLPNSPIHRSGRFCVTMPIRYNHALEFGDTLLKEK
jgi:hypothetical protein